MPHWQPMFWCSVQVSVFFMALSPKWKISPVCFFVCWLDIHEDFSLNSISKSELESWFFLFFSHVLNCVHLGFSPGFNGQHCTKFYDKVCVSSLSSTILPGQSVYWRKVDCSLNNGGADGDPPGCNLAKPVASFVPTGNFKLYIFAKVFWSFQCFDLFLLNDELPLFFQELWLWMPGKGTELGCFLVCKSPPVMITVWRQQTVKQLITTR